MPAPRWPSRSRACTRASAARHALRGLDLTVPTGQVTGFLGPNGVRQDHDDPHPARPAAGRRAAGSRCWAATRGRTPCSCTAASRTCPATSRCGPTSPAARRSTSSCRLSGPLDPRAQAGDARAVRARPHQEGPDLLQGQPAEGRPGRGAGLASAELLLLDEPTSGLDPLMEAAFTESIREVKAAGPLRAAVQPHLRRGGEAGRPRDDHPRGRHRRVRHDRRAAAPDPHPGHRRARRRGRRPGHAARGPRPRRSSTGTSLSRWTRPSCPPCSPRSRALEPALARRQPAVAGGPVPASLRRRARGTEQREPSSDRHVGAGAGRRAAAPAARSPSDALAGLGDDGAARRAAQPRPARGLVRRARRDARLRRVVLPRAVPHAGGARRLRRALRHARHQGADRAVAGRGHARRRGVDEGLDDDRAVAGDRRRRSSSPAAAAPTRSSGAPSCCAPGCSAGTPTPRRRGWSTACSASRSGSGSPLVVGRRRPRPGGRRDRRVARVRRVGRRRRAGRARRRRRRRARSPRPRAAPTRSPRRWSSAATCCGRSATSATVWRRWARRSAGASRCSRSAATAGGRS